MATTRKDILWEDKPGFAYIPGANGAVEYTMARAILTAEWRLASFLESDAVVVRFSDGQTAFCRGRAADDLPAGAEVIDSPGDHDHCCLAFCGASVHQSGEPEEAVGWFSAEHGWWLCETCHGAVERWRAVLEAGIAIRNL